MENEQITSHSEDVQQEDAVQGALAMFDLLPEEPEEITEPEETEEQETEEEPPATEEPANVRKVKFNKGDVEVKEDEIDGLLQQGLALPKERERKETYKAGLERAAKLAGYDSVDKYLAELDTIEQQAIQNRSNEIDTMKQQMLQEYADAGFDPAQLEAFIDNHPVFVNAKAITEREQAARDSDAEKQKQEAAVQAWGALLEAYPHLTEDLDDNGRAAWLTPELESKVNRGYDPIDAYKLIYGDKIAEEKRIATEQNIIKQQRLNKRAALGGTSTLEDETPQVPKELSSAFALFGLDPKDAQKYIKK